MDIKNAVNEFVNYVLNEDTQIRDLEELIRLLDKLAFATHFIKANFDEKEYPDAPENNYEEIYKKISKRFPALGYYNIAGNISDRISECDLQVGDAIDDITDIVGDLKEVLWCFDNTSESDALWRYVNGFKMHWGRHLRELQLYLYDLWL